MAERRKRFGTNSLPEPVTISFLEFVWEALHERTLIVLMVAAVAEIAIGIYKTIADNESTAVSNRSRFH